MANNNIMQPLIELVRKNPCLYDPKNASFKDRLRKKEIWQAIGEKLNISSNDSKTNWDQYRRKYIMRRSKDLPSDTSFDKMMSFLEGCYGREEKPIRTAMKPQLEAPESSMSISNQDNQATSSNGRLSTSENISSSTNHDAPRPDWLALLFEELSLKAKQLPMEKQLDIAKLVCEIIKETEGKEGTDESDEGECSYIA